MATLRWLKRNHATLPPTVVRAGKEVILNGTGYTVPPNSFQVYRTFSKPIRRFREARGKSPISEVDSISTHSNGTGSAQSNPWTLPPPPRRLKWNLVFEDSRLNRSPGLAVSRLGLIRPKGGLGVEGATVSLGLEITAAIDPLISLSVLTPWAPREEGLHALLHELAVDAADGEEDADSDALREYLGGYLPADPPKGWEFAISPDELELEEKKRARVSLTLYAPSAGAAAFAVEMAATVDGERLAVVSDLIAIEVPEDYELASLPFSEDDGRGGPGHQKMKVRHLDRPDIRITQPPEIAG